MQQKRLVSTLYLCVSQPGCCDKFFKMHCIILKHLQKYAKTATFTFILFSFSHLDFFSKIMCRNFKKVENHCSICSPDIQGTLYLFCTALSSTFARTGKKNALWSLQQPMWKRCPNRNIFLL